MRVSAQDRLKLRRLAMANLELAALEGKQAVPAIFTGTAIELEAHPITFTEGFRKARRWFGKTQGRGRVRAQRWLDDQLASATSLLDMARRLAAPSSDPAAIKEDSDG